MNDEVLFRGYDRAALAAQYNARAAVPEHGQIVERWENDNAQICRAFSSRLDLAYGASPAERLDVFPANGIESAPVQVFFHGGYWPRQKYLQISCQHICSRWRGIHYGQLRPAPQH